MATRVGILAVLVAGAGACADASNSDVRFGGVGKADFYGTDDRQQILDSQHPRAVEWARATAVVVNRINLSTSGGHVVASASTLGDRHGLCSNERFADEPALGFCSSFLVAPDLVATAGHCFKQTLCEEMAFVFDFYEGGASANLAALPAQNVYACREVVAKQFGGGLDYALVRLDRPTSGRTPFALQSQPPAEGSRVALLGYPSGIYAKLDIAGEVLRLEGSRIRTSVDSFPGHSGGVMIDLATGAAFGVHVEGSSPSFVGTGTCSITASCAQVLVDTSGPCNGAVETSVDVFAGCCDGSPTTPPPPPPDPPPAPGDDATCLPSGAPCDVSDECTNSMCACDTVNATTETFIAHGVCTTAGCADTEALCAKACAEMAPLDGNRFTYGWSAPMCADDW